MKVSLQDSNPPEPKDGLARGMGVQHAKSGDEFTRLRHQVLYHQVRYLGLFPYGTSNSRTSASSGAANFSCCSSTIFAPSPSLRSVPLRLTSPRATCTYAFLLFSISFSINFPPPIVPTYNSTSCLMVSAPSPPFGDATKLNLPLVRSRIDFCSYPGFSPRRLGMIQICKKCNGAEGDGLNSLCVMPVPAVIRCTSPAGMTLLVPRLSRCSTAPSRTYVIISISRWGWVPKPLPGATRSSLITRSTENPFSLGSKYSPNENVWRLSSQSSLVTPRYSALRTVIIFVSSFFLECARARKAGILENR